MLHRPVRLSGSTRVSHRGPGLKGEAGRPVAAMSLPGRRAAAGPALSS
jgi:hypothetical protein